MIPPDLLPLLCCPETHQALQLATPEIITRVNASIAASSLKNRAGQVVTAPIDGGLVRADGKFIYPIRANIPILLKDEALPIS